MKKYNCFFPFSLGLILELSLENPPKHGERNNKCKFI